MVDWSGYGCVCVGGVIRLFLLGVFFFGCVFGLVDFRLLFMFAVLFLRSLFFPD